MLKVGDKVKMIPRGFKFYSNVDTAFEMNCVTGVVNQKNFTSAICGLFAIHGVGTIKRFNSDGDPFIRWNFNINGTKYHYSHYFDKKDIRKLTFLEKLKRMFKC